MSYIALITADWHVRPAGQGPWGKHPELHGDDVSCD